MTVSPRAQSPHSPLRHRRAPAPFRLAAALAVAAALCLAPVPGEGAADEGRSVTVIDRDGHRVVGSHEPLGVAGEPTGFQQLRPAWGAIRDRLREVSRQWTRNVSGLDLNALPISAVERIEILDEGPVRHSAYAIGAAINIVLRTDYEGVEVSAGAGLPTQEGRDSQNGSALWGGALGRGHLTLGVAHIGREEVLDKDRHYSRAAWTPGGSIADTRGVSIAGNSIFFVPDDGDNDPDTSADPVYASLGPCDPSVYTGVLTHPAGEVCGYPYAEISWFDEFPQLSRESLILAADHPLGDDADVYVEARVAQGHSLLRYAPPVGTFEFEATGDVRQNLIDNVDGLDSTNFPEDDEVTVRHRFVGHGNRQWRGNVEEYGLTLGVQGGLGDDLGYDMHAEYYRHKTVTTGINLVSERLARAAIESGAYDIANPLSPADPTLHQQAIRDMALRLTRDTENERRRASAALEGTAFTMSGGAVRWTVGVEVEDREWQNVYDYRDSENRFHEVADVLGSGGASIAAERRRVSALAESTVPLLDGWDLTLGARRDDYDDVGEAVSLHAANRYRLNENLALRASWSRAARPPSLTELHSPEALGFPRVCDPVNKDPNGRPICTQQEMLTGGNPDLEPDSAERLSVGATAGFGAYSFAADWFTVEVSDIPDSVSAQTVVDRAAAGNPVPGTNVERDGQRIDKIRNLTAQEGESETEGFALHAGAAWETDRADLALDVRAVRTTHFEYRVLGVEQPGDFPRDRAHAVLRASRGDLTVSWNAHLVSGYSNTSEAGRYKGWHGHDVALQLRDALGLDGLDLTGGVLNVADRGPSIDSSGEDGPALTLDSVRGRTFFVNATMSW